MSHMGETPFGEALNPTNPPGAQSHFRTARRRRNTVPAPRSAGDADAVFFDSPGFTATFRAMQKILVPLLGAAVLFALGACARGQPKSSAHMYRGDAPTIKYNDKPETAGGHIHTY